jgi:hypothetical protein
MNEMNQALEEIASLPSNWNSYGAPPITRPAIKAARSLLDTLVNTQGSKLGDAVRPYSLVPLATGGLQVTWHGPHAAELEVEIGENGQLGYLLVPAEGLHKAVEQDEVSQKTIVGLLVKILESPSSNHIKD